MYYTKNGAIIIVSKEKEVLTMTETRKFYEEENENMTERERKDVRTALIYQLRLLFDADERETFNKDEILQMFDTIARAKETE